jgi:hypothetical protein
MYDMYVKYISMYVYTLSKIHNTRLKDFTL